MVNILPIYCAKLIKQNVLLKIKSYYIFKTSILIIKGKFMYNIKYENIYYGILPG
jgi:hypothetical protein